MSEHQSPSERPLPQPNAFSQPFFEAARQHVLKIQRCKRCGTNQLPGRFACDECLSGELEWVQASGRGKVFSFIIMHQRYHRAFGDEVPYNVAIVELEEGPRLVTNIVETASAEIQVGMPVSVTFEDVTEKIALPKFRPESD